MVSCLTRGGTLTVLVLGLLEVTLVSSQPCDIARIFNCLLPFNGSYPLVKNTPPAKLERVCRQEGISADDCLTLFRFRCDLEGRAFVDNVLHALSDMCSISTLQEYRAYSVCLSTLDTQKDLRKCQFTRQTSLDNCRIVERIVRCERDVVQTKCGSEVGAWYVLWSLQARTTLDAAAARCQVNLSMRQLTPIDEEGMVGSLGIVLIVTGVALFVLGLFVCGLYLCDCCRKEPEEETDALHVQPSDCTTPRRALQLY